MSRLKILDLSCCELVTEEHEEIKGGLTFNLPLPLFLFDDYEQTEIYADSETVVNKLENAQTGESGYEVLSKDGTSRTVALSGPNSTRSFSTAAYSFSTQ